jgi:hypothetical protein
LISLLKVSIPPWLLLKPQLLRLPKLPKRRVKAMKRVPRQRPGKQLNLLLPKADSQPID